MEFGVSLELGDEASNTIMHGIVNLMPFGRLWRQAYEAGALQSIQIFSFNHGEEIKLGNTSVGILGEASPILRRIPINGTFAILEKLSVIFVNFETLRLRLYKLLLPRRALFILGATVF